MAIGFDKLKSPFLMQRAYSNSNGIMEAYAAAVIRRMNKELGANFVVEQFCHHAYYEPHSGFIYSGIFSKCAQTAQIRDREFSFKEGEFVRMHRSRKWKVTETEEMFRNEGFVKIGFFQDDKESFFYLLLERE